MTRYADGSYRTKQRGVGAVADHGADVMNMNHADCVLHEVNMTNQN